MNDPYDHYKLPAGVKVQLALTVTDPETLVKVEEMLRNEYYRGVGDGDLFRRYMARSNDPKGSR